MDPLILRGIERIIVILIGGVSFYLGYYLLSKHRSRKDENSGGTFKLPGGVEIDIQRVAPGVFLCLFGAIIVAASLFRPITITNGSSDDTDYQSYSGFGGNSEIDFNAHRNLITQDMSFINNSLPDLLSTDLSAEQSVEVTLALERIKLDLMKGIWEADWGDYPEFEHQIVTGQPIEEGTPFYEPYSIFLSD